MKYLNTDVLFLFKKVHLNLHRIDQSLSMTYFDKRLRPVFSVLYEHPQRIVAELQWWTSCYIIYLAPLSTLGPFGSNSGAVIKLHAYCSWFIGLGVNIQWSWPHLSPESDCINTPLASTINERNYVSESTVTQVSELLCSCLKGTEGVGIIQLHVNVWVLLLFVKLNDEKII